MTRHFTYYNFPSISRTQVCRLRQAGSKRTERICRIKILWVVTKQSHVEVGSIACHASPNLLLPKYRMLNHNLSKVRDILECLVGPSFAVFYPMRRSCSSRRAHDSVLPRRIVLLYATYKNLQFVDGERIPAHAFMYPEYFGGVVLSPSLANLSFLYWFGHVDRR